MVVLIVDPGTWDGVSVVAGELFDEVVFVRAVIAVG